MKRILGRSAADAVVRRPADIQVTNNNKLETIKRRIAKSLHLKPEPPAEVWLANANEVRNEVPAGKGLSA